MVNQTKRECLESIRERYERAGRKYKTKILDEFTETCGYHRKHAIRLLNGKARRRRHRPGPSARYGELVRKALKDLWFLTNRPCSKILKAAIPIWLPYYERTTRLEKDTSKNLLSISPASIDRLMQPVRKKYGSHGLPGTRPVQTLKNQIPIRTSHSDVDRPGYIQADSVAHGGNSMEGDFAWSVTMTDVCSQWTENRAVWNKGYIGVAKSISDMEKVFPFSILGFHTDNGGEFLNHHLYRYFKEHRPPVQFTRTRPDHKDDNCYVEQKNWSRVRLLLGYQRIDDANLIDPINQLYQTWDLYNNFFCPNMKLISKTKIGSRYRKRYDDPLTPAQRILSNPHTNEAVKQHLTEISLNLDPLSLKKYIDRYQKSILTKIQQYKSTAVPF
jgi:hypothetical protein